MRDHDLQVLSIVGPREGQDEDAQQYRRERAQLFATEALARLEREHEATGNALCAWHAWRIARRADLGLPAWVVRCLDESAERLLSVDPPRPGQAGREALGALGLATSGRGTAFSRFHDAGERLHAVRSVLAEVVEEFKQKERDRLAQVAASEVEVHRSAREPKEIPWPAIREEAARRLLDWHGLAVEPDTLRKWQEEAQEILDPRT